MRLDDWMAAANAHYYASRDPLGTDFITAPEISQMFGEMIGGWVGDLWLRARSPAVRLVELGPGRGTLMADALRVLGRLPGWNGTPVALVETSPALHAAQASRIAADWFDRIEAVPADLPLIVIANEFFDALPIRQFDGAGGERGVAWERGAFVSTTLPAPGTRQSETCAAGAAIVAHLASCFATQGGALLVIDYGYAGLPASDSLQAVRSHAPADPFADPGEQDLTTHVDFAALAAAASGVRVDGPVTQGVWLARLGIEGRAAQLHAGANPADGAKVAAALVRLTAPTQMGVLFKVMAVSAPHWPQPAGFA